MAGQGESFVRVRELMGASHGADIYGDRWNVGISHCESFVFMGVIEDDTSISHSYTESGARSLAAALIEKADELKRLRGVG